MSTNFYKWLSLALGIVVIGLLVFIFTRPKQVDTVALNNDLAQFSAELQQWNASYTANPTPQGEQQLSQDLSDFSNKLKSDSNQ
jgi:hypothetical protein